MTSELQALAWAGLLAILHLLAPALLRVRQYGAAWGAGARDEAVPPPTPLAGRLARAQSNYYESFPLFAAAILVIYVADLESPTTLLAAWTWLAARVAFLALYAAGVPYVRSVAWGASILALVTLLLQPLLA